MRASVLPNLPKEPLVIIRGSFLRLCDDDHCAAALLNVLVYWHDWSLDRQRQDATAVAADPDHRPAEPGHWIWRTMQDLVTDLLGLFGEKVVRRAVTILEDKCFIESRGNPRDPRDRTRQFRLRFEAVEAALNDIPPNGGLQAANMPNATAKMPAQRNQRFATMTGGKKTKCRQQKCRLF